MSGVRNSHVVIDSTTTPAHLRCLHCGAAEDLGLPLSVTAFGKVAGTFSQAHAACEKPGPLAPVYVEIVDPSGRVAYRRMSDHPDVQEALRRPGYSVRCAAEQIQEAQK